MYCEKCGGRLVGDGYMSVFRCEYAEYSDYKWRSPDDNPIYCRYEDDKEYSSRDGETVPEDNS